ncbi:MAG: dihydropteroate synthase [Bacteroidales bacterium]|nr:dihydropteroate synthase [Bacteroidales bacterium]
MYLTTKIMGILNLTPDSFYPGSRVQTDDFLQRFTGMLEEGADVVDIGACSTRPGAPQPSLEEEWRRLEPALEVLAEAGGREAFSGAFARTGSRSDAEEKASPLPELSIDTYRSEIVQRAYEHIGPFMVNDISAGALDPNMLETVGRLGLPYVAMHMRGTPENMQEYTEYQDIIADINAYFRAFAARAEAAGIRQWILDPGFGFSKTLEQNWELLRRLDQIQTGGHEMLVGLSRKSMVYKKLGITPEEAMPATQVVQAAALQKGATWLRVHDVKAAAQTARLYSTIYTSSPGAAK